MQNRNWLAGRQSTNFNFSQAQARGGTRNSGPVLYIVVYKQAETKTKELVGRVACRLSAENYGASEWWLLLEPQM